MTLPVSGALTLADIQGEFGGVNPIGLNEYYAGGGLVPPGTTGTHGAVPSSGEISVYNFYGTSNTFPLLWGSTGTTSHPTISLFFGTYGSENAYITAYTSGVIFFGGPTDAGGSTYDDTYVGGGSTAGYRIRIYNSSTYYTFYDPNGNPISPGGNWSSYFYLTTDRTFNLPGPDANFSGVVEFSNSDNSQYMSANFDGSIYRYA